MKPLLHNIRFYILTISLIYSGIIYLWVSHSISSPQAQTIRLQQIYALTAVAMLYTALLASPLTHVFQSFPFQKYYLKSRRAMGVSAFYFAFLHASLAFFVQLGGFSGLGFLNSRYIIAITLSSTALIILFSLTITSFDWVITKITFPKWKLLHRFVYLAGILILIHAAMLGTHFQDLSSIIPQFLFTALIFLLTLEALRLDNFLYNKFPKLPQFGISFLAISAITLTYFTFILLPQDSPLTIGVHDEHLRLAKLAQQPIANPTTSLTGQTGDSTKRFTLDFDHPIDLPPNQDIPLTFTIYDASSGNQTVLFDRVYEQLLHLVIVDSQLEFFNHLHPEFTNNQFTITTQFPHPGNYHLYLDFQPFGALEQQIAVTLNVGNVPHKVPSNILLDSNLTKTFDDYQVTLTYPQPLQASQLSIGQQELNFTIQDAQTAQPMTTLKPYLASYGHLVMINQQTYDYIHVHPSDLTPPQPNQNGGPHVSFLPLGINGPIKPGIYRVFAQFNPDHHLFTSDFTIHIQ